jgi:hypothetical protein
MKAAQLGVGERLQPAPEKYGCRNSIAPAIWWPEAASKPYRWNRKEITEYERNYTLGSIQAHLLQWTPFFFRTIKSWSGLTGD